ncbi:MAG: beta-galactosidase [Kiritimatiellae bacterium]|nr:beta-galactosidase [Kiritimatiellia bacterium]
MTNAFLLFAAAAQMATTWCEKSVPADAWTEYPRPQMVRENWTNLNGTWDYALVTNNAAGIPVTHATGKIRVPYCFESPLSGVGRLVTAADRMIYRRMVDLHPKAGRRLLLNFEAVDYSAQVFLNGVEATDVPHEGGNLPFTVDLTPFAKEGSNALEVRVWDPTDSQYGGRGKQSAAPGGCFYTRVSGIWQTVWLEDVPDEHVTAFAVDADLDAATATFRVESSKSREAAAEIVVTDAGREIARGVAGKPIKIPGALKLWTPDAPHLYGYEMRLGADRTTGYFAMRKASTVEDRNGDRRFALNDEVFYPLATLDQGWWPDGLLTPPCEAAMKHDILTLKACGFNAMRKHIKVEPRRYYYLCDVLGMAVLQDLPCGFRSNAYDDQEFARLRYGFSRQEMKDMIDHLRNAPCVLMWIPYNEGWGQPGAALTREMLRWVKRYDPSRLVNGPSGWNDWEGGARFKDVAKGWESGFVQGPRDFDADRKPSSDSVDMHKYPGPAMPGAGGGRVSFLGEYGGLGLKIPGHLWNESGSWGYAGTGKVTSRDETQAHYLKLLDGVRDLVTHGLAGSVYTQTTDVETEINGIMTYDRKVLKFDAAALKQAHGKVLATSWDLGRKGWSPSADGTVEAAGAGTYRMYVKTAALKAGNPKVDGKEIAPAARERDAARTWTFCGDVPFAGKTAKVAFSDPAGVVFMPAGDPMRPPEARVQRDFYAESMR